MGSKPKDAFAGLMSSVPGIDTSGFVKKSLNDLKSKRKDLGARQFQSLQPRGGSGPASGSPASPPIAPRAARAVHCDPNDKSEGFGGAKGASSRANADAVLPTELQIASGDLDFLGVQKTHVPASSGLHAEARCMDPFEAFPGTEVEVDLQEATARVEDLLGPGVDPSGVVESLTKTEFIEIDPNPYSDTKPSVEDFEFQNVLQYSQGRADPGNGVSALLSPTARIEDTAKHPNEDFTREDSTSSRPDPKDAPSGEGSSAAVDDKEDLSDMDSDEFYSAVVSEDRSNQRNKFGGLPPHLSSAGKAVLARIARIKRGSEERGSGEASGQNRILKYSSSIQKKALAYSKKGLGAVKQGLEAASDWMEKQMEERKRALPGKCSPESEFDMDVVEMAAELQNLSPTDRSLVLEHMDSSLQRRVRQYIASQESIRAGMSRPQTSDSLTRKEGSRSESQTEGSEGGHDYAGSQKLQRPLSIPDFRVPRDHEQLLHPGGMSAPNLHDPVVDNDSDFLNLDEDNEIEDSSTAPAKPFESTPATLDPDDLDDFFGGGPSRPTQQDAQASSASPQPSPMEDIFDEPGPAAFGDDLIDIGSRPPMVSNQHSDLYEEAPGGSANEPHIRRVLREQRTREKHMKMQDALQEKLLREQELAEFHENQQDLKRAIGPRIKEWKDANQGNIRGLLATLHTVLWDNSGWEKVSVGDILDNVQVKKMYRKANLIVHPDKVRQKNGTEDQTAVADMVFDVLKEAWAQFTG